MLKNSILLMRSILIIFLCVLFFSCKEQEARRPIQQSITNFYKELVEQNRKLIAFENSIIEAYLKNDSLNKYKSSKSGYWYTYIQKKEEGEYPKSDDLVKIEIEILNLDNSVIYIKEIKDYRVDKEDFPAALQDGIKTMKVGETVLFIVPSYRAYGITGDGNKINSNQTIKTIITLKEIINNED